MSELLRVIPSITLKLAQAALATALAEAERHAVKVSIAIVGPGGEPVLSAHMDDAPAPSRTIALNKATSAAGFRSSTADWEARLERCSSMVRQGLPLQGGLALFGGGEPFLYQGEVVGAIGISGASEALDIACARAARSGVERLLQGTSEQASGSSVVA